MSIVSMKRLTAIVPRDERKKLLRSLYKIGCVEIETLENDSSVKESSGSSDSESIVLSALSELYRVSPGKKKLLSPKREVSEEELFSDDNNYEAYKTAKEICDLIALRNKSKEEIASTENEIKSLIPWVDNPVPLDFKGTKTVSFFCATIPSSVKKDAVIESVADYPCSVNIIRTDGELHYISAYFYKADEEQCFDNLKALGATKVSFKYRKTAKDEIACLRERIKELKNSVSDTEKNIALFADKKELLENAADAFAQESSRDELLSSVERTKETVILNGWIPEEESFRLQKIFESHGCAWELYDPEEGDDVPTALKSGKISSPFNMITEMYGMPAYNSIVDPNPLITPFYIVFFGFIMADLAYGLIILLGCLLGLKLMKPKGGTKDLLTIFAYCGLSSAVAGFLLGGFFADVVTVFSQTFLNKTVSMPVIWFDPLKEPMTMLIFSLALGAVQILFSMGVSGYRQIKRGDAWGAFFDVGSWYLIFGGLIVNFALSKVGIYITLAGVLLLLCTAGRDKKGFGKVTGGLGALYGVTGYLSDLLSYSRIMALALSGAVVGQVVNKMGAIGGRSIVGFIVFLLVFLVGHTFNIAISVLGAYVHTSRLQYVEFFGRFYEGGGRVFDPLVNKTKFINIREE
ncbi:MAG: V-type ATP synthase subunit I [Clostridia bacterium]|nr:V-type ATP synthase subunit I [Clostridia bacterium]